MINKWMTDIDQASSEINEICEKADIDLENNGLLESEILESEFISQVFKKLSEIESIVSTPPSPSTLVLIQNGTTKQQLCTQVPKVQCTKFIGKEIGKFKFKNFLAQFKNCVALVEPPKVFWPATRLNWFRIFLSKMKIMTWLLIS